MNALVRIVVAATLVMFLTGSSCFVSYCSSTCDPCFEQCESCVKRHDCDAHTTAALRSAHELELYDFAVRSDPSGAMTRVYANILGLALERLHGRGPYPAERFIEFTRDVLRANPDLFGSSTQSKRWTFDRMDRFGECALVRWERVPVAADARRASAPVDSVLCFFDERANLVEIDYEVQPPPADRTPSQ